MAGAKTAANWLAEEFTTRWARALEGMTGEKPVVVCLPLVGPVPDGIEWWEQPYSVPSGATVFAGATSADSILLGGKVLEAAGVEANPEDARGTYFETLNQALSGLGQALTARLHKEVTCTAGKSCPVPDSNTTGLTTIQITLPGQNPIELMASFSPEMIAALDAESKPVKQAAAAAGSAAVLPVAGAPVPAAILQGPARTMELLYDVELPVSVSFGRAQLPLKDVIKLTSGSIVELNRSVTEPVEIIVNNCVIARGEVVVIEGNYGVRIDQIISRQDRLRTLK